MFNCVIKAVKGSEKFIIFATAVGTAPLTTSAPYFDVMFSAIIEHIFFN